MANLKVAGHVPTDFVWFDDEVEHHHQSMMSGMVVPSYWMPEQCWHDPRVILGYCMQALNTAVGYGVACGLANYWGTNTPAYGLGFAREAFTGGHNASSHLSPDSYQQLSEHPISTLKCCNPMI